MSQKINIVFGVNGQIGSYLGEYLLERKEKVVGVARRVSSPNIERIKSILPHKDFKLLCGDITDPFSLLRIFNEVISDKDCEYIIYNLAAMSQVHTSFNQPLLSADVTGIGHLNLLEVLLSFHRLGFKLKVYNQSSSEIFGGQVGIGGFQDLDTLYFPNSPYAAAKLYAFHMNRIYRESYGMFTCSGIIFNTESPRRSSEFVTKKITQFFAKFAHNNFSLQEKLQLGNIYASRDWTHAKDTVEAIYLIANNYRPKDYIVASGQTHTVHDFMKECYKSLEIIYGNKINLPLEQLYEINKDCIRPNEVKYLKGNATEIKNDLGWKPTISFPLLVDDMLSYDIVNYKREQL